MSRTAKHDHWLLQQLADAEFAAEFLNAASKDVDPVLVHRQWPVFQESLKRFPALSSAVDRFGRGLASGQGCRASKRPAAAATPSHSWR